MHQTPASLNNMSNDLAFSIALLLHNDECSENDH